MPDFWLCADLTAERSLVAPVALETPLAAFEPGEAERRLLWVKALVALYLSAPALAAPLTFSLGDAAPASVDL